MNHAFLTDLPPEIIINILSRLPIKTIINCKCVCKSWFDLLAAHKFARSHLSRSMPGLITYQIDYQMSSELLQVYEFENEAEFQEIVPNEIHYSPITEFDMREVIARPNALLYMQGTVDGLICLYDIRGPLDTIYLCNPITREYIKLPHPEGIVQWPQRVVSYGFGLSNGQYKVVRIFQECLYDPGTGSIQSITKSECQVYTMGTGSWRSIAPGGIYQYKSHSSGAFLNGKIHWVVADLKGSQLISCFDLESEQFSSFPLPPLPGSSRTFLVAPVVLGNLLHVCDNSSDDEIVIWTMKEYGNENSWTKDFIISKIPDFAGPSSDAVYPLKIFKDGDVLLLWDDAFLFHYSNKTKSTAKIDMFQMQIPDRIEARLHVSSFVSLKSVIMENVISF